MKAFLQGIRRCLLTKRALLIIVLLLAGGLLYAATVAQRRTQAAALLNRLGAKVHHHNSLGRYGPNLPMQYQSMDWIDLTATTASDADLASVWDAFPEVERLDLANARITDQTLDALGHLRRLRVLDLTGTRVSDRGVAGLTRLPRLEYLYLERTDITDRALAALNDLPSLKSLDIVETRATQAGVKTLVVERPSLGVVWSPRPGDRHLRAARRIEELGGHATPDPRSFEYLVICPTDWRGRAEGLDGIADLERVTIVGVFGTWFGDDGLKHLMPIKGLRKLSLIKTAVTPTGLLQLKGLSRPERMRDYGCVRLPASDFGSGQTASEVADSLPTLKRKRDEARDE